MYLFAYDYYIHFGLYINMNILYLYLCVIHDINVEYIAIFAGRLPPCAYITKLCSTARVHIPKFRW